MLITRMSILSGKAHSLDLDVTQEQIDRWRSGWVAQMAFPNLTKEEREFLISGITPEEWAAHFGHKEDADVDPNDALTHFSVTDPGTAPNPEPR